MMYDDMVTDGDTTAGGRVRLAIVSCCCSMRAELRVVPLSLLLVMMILEWNLYLTVGFQVERGETSEV
jgi:hypothetical protein